MRKVIVIVVAVLMIGSVCFAQPLPQAKNQEPKVVTMNDGTKVVVILVPATNPVTKAETVQAVAFTKESLDLMKADADKKHTDSAAQIDSLANLLK
jgi:hypothetical protein